MKFTGLLAVAVLAQSVSAHCEYLPLFYKVLKLNPA
jgi:hypothetical protein